MTVYDAAVRDRVRPQHGGPRTEVGRADALRATAGRCRRRRASRRRSGRPGPTGSWPTHSHGSAVIRAASCSRSRWLRVQPRIVPTSVPRTVGSITSSFEAGQHVLERRSARRTTTWAPTAARGPGRAPRRASRGRYVSSAGFSSTELPSGLTTLTVPGAHGPDQPGDAEARALPQVQRVAPLGVDAPQHHVDRLEALDAPHPDAAVADQQVGALDERQAEHRRQVRLVERGLAGRPGREQDDARAARRARGDVPQREPQRAEERSEPLDRRLPVHPREHLRDDAAVLHRVADARRRLRPVRDRAPRRPRRRAPGPSP